MIKKWSIVVMLAFALISCQSPFSSTRTEPTATTQSLVPTNKPDLDNTSLSLSIDHMLVHDLFEGAVLIGKYDALHFYGSPKESLSLLCCRLSQHTDTEDYTRDSSWVSRYEMDALYPLSLVPDSMEQLSNADIEQGNLVFLRQARAWQTGDSLLAIENGKTYFSYLILSKTKDGWRIAEINTAYPTENLLGEWSPEATMTAQSPSPSAYLETVASQPDTYLSLAKVSGFITRADLQLRGITNKAVLPDDEFEEDLTNFVEQLNQPQLVIVEQLLPLPFTESGSSMTSMDIQQHRVVIEAMLIVDGDPMLWFFTLERSEGGLQIIKVAQHYP